MTEEPKHGPLVFIDTETTGLHHKREPWEVAMIRREPDGSETETLLQIGGLRFFRDAEPMALKVGRFYERYRWGSSGDYTPEEAACEIEAITRGASLVAANPAFDASTLAAFLRRNGLVPSWHYHLIDIEAVAIGWLIGKGDMPTIPAKSDDLSKRCGVDSATYDRHTALGDAQWVRDWFDAIYPQAAS